MGQAECLLTPSEIPFFKGAYAVLNGGVTLRTGRKHSLEVVIHWKIGFLTHENI